MNDLRRQVERLKQFGAMGSTLADQLHKLRDSSELMADLLPWVPFDREGILKCYALPTHAGIGYEAIRVNTNGRAVFPGEPYSEFILVNIQQTVFMLGGRLEVTVDGVLHTLLAGDSIRIPQGSRVRLVYTDADCVFRQVPRIASEEQDMRLL